MATIALNQQDSLLRNALRGNSIFSTVSGLVLLFGANAVTELLGTGTPLLYMGLALGLFGWAFYVYQIVRQETINPALAWGVVAGALVWVLGSAVILLSNVFNLTNAGNWAVLIIADMVLVFAIAQTIGIRRMRKA